MKSRRQKSPQISPKRFIFSCLILTLLGLLLLTILTGDDLPAGTTVPPPPETVITTAKAAVTCATVEEMGSEAVGGGDSWKESLKVRRLIRNHFEIQGASRVRLLSPDQFCKQNFVMGKASEAGFGNEMYKILTAAALSVMLNRSLIIGQTRGKYPFGDYITYANFSFTLREVKHLWKKHNCVGNYGRHLVMRVDDFEKPSETSVLCGNWRKWKQPIIWFKGTTDAVAAQFFLKNIHVQMRKSASALFGKTEVLRSRPNVIGELLRAIISPSPDVEKTVNSVINGGRDPHLAVHMRMLMNRSPRAINAVLNCIKTTIAGIHQPRVVLISDTPSLVNDLTPKLRGFTEVLHFDYKKFKGNISSGSAVAADGVGFRAKDWGPAPRWVAFVDFFLASRATHAVITGAQRRVGTTYAQLIAALAATYQLDQEHDGPANFSFISSFQNNLLHGGLQNQVGWGHVWNRFAGPLSCRSQPSQCALTPVLPPGWWDGLWQSPISRDVRRMEAFGVKLSGFGTIDENRLRYHCKAKKARVRTIPICTGFKCLSPRAINAVLNCIKTTIAGIHQPRVVLISDTPSLVNDLTPKLRGFTEVLHFDYKKFKGNISSGSVVAADGVGFRAKDWGPAPRWVAFVDFFLASRATHAVITGAQRRVGTTYAQLIAALAATYQLDQEHDGPANFSFISSFQNNLLHGGLQNQVGWGHVWNRFAGPLSCRSQPSQCALTPVLPPGWWDGLWQSPISRDVRRMEAFGVKLSGFGTIDENRLRYHCKAKKARVRTIPICTGFKCL
ncbi:hypothetical protein SSX86_000322 [Deinandra increscens subsp. villosa]|uniref:Uncharacterized protein n=1 Tax=Deinandra increscens subsp. villosa TaxID=3103831 RepID=A0AAP0HBH8_9ASTR